MTAYLPATRSLRERVDTAQALTRFHYLERALTLACGAWIAAVPRLETKAVLARAAWQSALVGEALRERVFELRYPSRLLDAGADAPLIHVYEAAVDAPDAPSFLGGLSDALLPALLGAYRDFLAADDELADGPTVRIVDAAVRDKEEQIEALRTGGDSTWSRELARALESLDPPRGTPFRVPDEPARDDRYFRSSFYWPDILDPDFPYGEGIRLQLRSAVSHLNEVWAVDTAGAILWALAPELGWKWIHEAARWAYDEARHMLMGKRRLDGWGLDPATIPLGAYIYEACAGEEAIYRLGMLGYFETKNIGRKRERAREFRHMGDLTSEVDMEFDWADETLHAELGRRWLKRLLEARGQDPEGWEAVLDRCEQLGDRTSEADME
ncbi:MAG: DUF455 family protein, partial [Actinomycetota bacterium]|nr:DUF455 family protein [Actinomycetota bacterium]